MFSIQTFIQNALTRTRVSGSKVAPKYRSLICSHSVIERSIQEEMNIGNGRLKRLEGDTLDELTLCKRQKNRKAQRTQRESFKSREKDNNTNNDERSKDVHNIYKSIPTDITTISQVSEAMQELKEMSMDVRKQNEAYGRLYRWKVQYRLPNNKTIVKDESSLVTILEVKRNEPQRKTGIDSEWLIWLGVKCSNIPNAGNGLFAMRWFLKRQTIAYYFGSKASETCERRNKYQCGKIDAVGGLSCKRARLCLGVHFANDPTIEKMIPLVFFEGARHVTIPLCTNTNIYRLLNHTLGSLFAFVLTVAPSTSTIGRTLSTCSSTSITYVHSTKLTIECNEELSFLLTFLTKNLVASSAS
jgi:hypothetical protein